MNINFLYSIESLKQSSRANNYSYRLTSSLSMSIETLSSVNASLLAIEEPLKDLIIIGRNKSN